MKTTTSHTQSVTPLLSTLTDTYVATTNE